MATRTTTELPVVRASSRYVRTAPRKVRVVADQVRGMGVDEAIAMLRFSPRGASVPVMKLIQSAAANAENNHDLDPEDMVISEISVDEGPTLRRFRARARGRATRIEKRTCHLKLAITPSMDDE
jgi:large subunit ribosomal protein L22